MTPENFREALYRFGDHPDRIAELRKVAVGLAIAGHWKAGADMRCAADLAGAIEAEKASLVGAGAISKPRTYQPVRPDDLPDVFKNSATFVPLGQIARIEKGQTGIKQAVPGHYPLVVTAAKRSSCDHFDFEGAAAVIPLVSATGHGNASINRLHYQEGKFALGTILAAVFPYAPEIISARFLFEYLSAFKNDLLVSRMNGTANVTLSIGRIAEVPVPLISPEVQGQLDTFMGLCDQLEAAQAKREAGRERLTAATLARLNSPDHEIFPSDARFALDNLTPLTTRPEQIEHLRQTILNLAVRGKLVEQNKTDESGEALVARLDEAKSRLVSAGKMKTRKALFPINPGEEPFPIPKSWTWQPLARVALKITDGEHISPNKTASGMPLLTAVHVTADGLKLVNPQFVSEEDGTKFRLRCDPQRGDILVCSRGTIGRCAIVDTDNVFCLMGSVIQIRLPRECSARYIFHFLTTDCAQQRMRGMSGATAVSALYLKDIRHCPLPIPPLAEQERIAAKVDELLALCDQLEASLAKGEQTRSRLLTSVLHIALKAA